MPLLRFSFPLGRPTLSQFPADCSEKAQRDFSPRVVHTLFLLNLGLQLFDGLSTYQGVQLGWQESNPMLQALMMHWGVGWALLGAKSAACALLLLLRCLGTNRLIAQALTLTAAYYFTLSFLPWMSLLLLCSAG